MNKQELKQHAELIVKELTRTELEERYLELYEKYSDMRANENELSPVVISSLPSDEEFETALEKEAFRVPYDGSDNYYDEPTIKHWRKCWGWVKSVVDNAT